MEKLRREALLVLLLTPYSVGGIAALSPELQVQRLRTRQVRTGGHGGRYGIVLNLLLVTSAGVRREVRCGSLTRLLHGIPKDSNDVSRMLAHGKRYGLWKTQGNCHQEM